MAEIITLHPRADAPIVCPNFGKRPKGSPVIGLDALAHIGGAFDAARGMEAAREDDKRQQENFKRIRRELRAAERAALGDAKHVCPSLISNLAARVSWLATSAEHLAAEAKSYGLLKAAVQLREHAHLLETLGAELEPDQPA